MSEEKEQRTERFVVLAGLTPFGEEIELRLPYPVSPGICKMYLALKPLLKSGDLTLEFLYDERRPLFRSKEPHDKYKELDRPEYTARELAERVRQDYETPI